jgi:RNA polymerase sigma-70 factor (ECF subfamily)
LAPPANEPAPFTRSNPTLEAVERVARRSYGRLVSFLSARSGDVSGAEDALSEAFIAALRTWPSGGVPSNPEAWLLHAARRRLIDRMRLERTRDAYADQLRNVLAEAEDLSTTQSFPDERLKLLFVCAHPAIDARIHTPLMLNAVLGLDAAAIAAAFVTPATTMGQRLSRAKAKIKETRVAFAVPTGAELGPRLFAVLQAIYAAYAHGWDDVDGADAKRGGLSQEAIWLARVLVELLPEEPEALGLLALMQYCEARRPARRTPEGEYVPISEQDTRLWLRPRLDEAEHLLARAAAFGRPGRFQLEAAVQSAHAERARASDASGRIPEGAAVDWAAIAVLYEGLVRVAPTLGALVGRAAAVGAAHGAAQGLALLDLIPEDAVTAYQPYWAVRAHFQRELGRSAEARAALTAALRLTEDPAVRRFLERTADR